MAKTLYPYNLLFDLSIREGDFPDGLPNDFDASLRYVLSTIDESDRAMLLYCYRDGMTHSQISQVMGFGANPQSVYQGIKSVLKLIKNSYRFAILRYGLNGWINSEIEEVQDMFFEMSMKDFDKILPQTVLTRKSIYSSKLSRVTCDTLSNIGGIHTLGDLTKITWDELTDIPGISNSTAIEILSMMKKNGLKLIPTEPTSEVKKPKPLKPSSYAHRLLSQIYDETWNHPLPNDYDETFSYIVEHVLTEEELLILNDSFALGMSQIEIEEVEDIRRSDIIMSLNSSFRKIEQIGAMDLLINGLNYYMEGNASIQDMPLLMMMKNDKISLSFKTIKALSYYDILTVGKLHNRIVHSYKLICRMTPRSIYEIISVLNYYNLDAGIINLYTYLPKNILCYLIANGITSVEKLKNTSDTSLMKMYGVGERRISKIKVALERYDANMNRNRDRVTRVQMRN